MPPIPALRPAPTPHSDRGGWSPSSGLPGRAKLPIPHSARYFGQPFRTRTGGRGMNSALRPVEKENTIHTIFFGQSRTRTGKGGARHPAKSRTRTGHHPLSNNQKGAFPWPGFVRAACAPGTNAALRPGGHEPRPAGLASPKSRGSEPSAPRSLPTGPSKRPPGPGRLPQRPPNFRFWPHGNNGTASRHLVLFIRAARERGHVEGANPP